jgi:hypothetical protein
MNQEEKGKKWKVIISLVWIESTIYFNNIPTVFPKVRVEKIRKQPETYLWPDVPRFYAILLHVLILLEEMKWEASHWYLLGPEVDPVDHTLHHDHLEFLFLYEKDDKKCLKVKLNHRQILPREEEAIPLL